jgi:hypothetical protein
MNSKLLLNPYPCRLGVALRGRLYRVSLPSYSHNIISKQWHEFQLALGVGFIRGVGARSISSLTGQFGPTHSLPCLAATETRVLQLEDHPEKSVEDAKKMATVSGGLNIRGSSLLLSFLSFLPSRDSRQPIRPCCLYL